MESGTSQPAEQAANFVVNSARENGNLQHGAVSEDEKLVRKRVGERNLVSLTLTGFLLKDDRGLLKTGILSKQIYQGFIRLDFHEGVCKGSENGLLMASLLIIDFSHMTAHEMTQGLLFITTHHRVSQRN